MSDHTTHRHRLVTLVALAFVGSSLGQVSQVVPTNYISASPVAEQVVTRVEVSHNSHSAIRQGLLDPKTIGLVAASTHLTAMDLSSVAVAPDPGTNEVWLYQIRVNTNAWAVFGKKLELYVHGRLEGHTKEFLLDMLTNSNRHLDTAGPDHRALLSRHPGLPVELLHRSNRECETNLPGEIFRTAVYYYVDGEVAWCYALSFADDNTLLGDSEWRVDAKEYDPKYQQIMRDIDQEVIAEMGDSKGRVRLGAVHTFSFAKKKKLGAKGISYRSFQELNPGIVF